MSGAMSIVVSLALGSDIVLVPMTPGIAQAYEDSMGTKDLPFRPHQPKSLSMRKAARAMYPESSSIAMKKNRMRICGRNMMIPPMPAMMPFSTRFARMGMFAASGKSTWFSLYSSVPRYPPIEPKVPSMKSMNGPASAKIE